MLTVWDGRRERTPRTFLSHNDALVHGIDFRFITEQVTTPTDWCFEEPNHTIVVYRGGRLRAMEIEFERGPSGRTIPEVGDVWVILAEHRYAALAHGDTVRFCELTVPTGLMDDYPLAPRTRHRDPLVYHIIERMSTIVDREDVIARLLTASLAEAARLHLISEFTTGRRRHSRERGVLDRATQARLAEYLEDSLDSDISLSSLAEHADMTMSEFLPAFSAAFHTTPYQFVLDRRIERAKTLLTTTAVSITEIATAVGFSTPSHFATTFKNRVGVTPSSYRRDS